MPRPTDKAPCGSKSTSSTRRPYSARAAPRLMVLVVLPTPPFWLQTARMRAGPCVRSRLGSLNVGVTRPVGPTPAAWPRASELGMAPGAAAVLRALTVGGRDGALGGAAGRLRAVVAAAAFPGAAEREAALAGAVADVV